MYFIKLICDAPFHALLQIVDLELSKLLASFITPINLQHVESDSLAQRPTLSYSHQITLLDTETRRNMSSKILMSFLVPVIFLHKMEIVTTKKTPVSPVPKQEELYRMMTVRCIFAETTIPERIRPRIEIWPVKGHFLSKSISDVVEMGAYRYRFLQLLLWEF
jgi:Cu2+-containing amine oxidase